MPELPEVETMCRGIRAVVGRRIDRVHAPRCRYRPIAMEPKLATLRARLRDQRIEEVSRLGKRVVIHAAEHALVFEPRMTGLVTLANAPDPDHVRLILELDGAADTPLIFWDRRGLGTIRLIPLVELSERIVAGRLGPDALEIELDDFAARLAKTERPIKVALLDQRLVAGVGNLYASEMLYVARLHPAIASARLDRRQIRRLHAAMRTILLDAIAHEGSTLSDGTYRNALNAPGGYQQHHRVYARAGSPCASCATMIERIVQAQRATFFCPRCQSDAH